MSESNQDFLKSLMEASSLQQTLTLATLNNLANQSPQMADAAYRCALVHWFNEDIIQALIVEGEPKHLGRPFDRTTPADPASLYHQLQSLPFVKEYSGRGHRFHGLTRSALLDYLWREEHDFYQLVSGLAADYFDEKLAEQLAIDQDDKLVDWDLLVELAYHFLIVDELQALDDLPDWLNNLVALGLLGQCHALVQAAEEHAAAGRLYPQTAIIVRYWRSYIAYLTNDYPLVETIARELMASEEDNIPVWVQTQTTYYWADSLRLMGQYDEAQKNFLSLLDLASGPEPETEEKIEALLGLGLIAESRNDFEEAETRYEQALETAVIDNVFIDIEIDDDDNFVVIKGMPPEVPLPPGLQLFEPESWQPFALPIISEEELASDNGSEQVAESNYIILCVIDSDDDALIDTAEDEDDGAQIFAVVADVILARIWLQLGYLYEDWDKYDRAAACARLAGQIYDDLGDIYGVQSVLQLLYSLGAILRDFELMELGSDYQQELLTLAREQNNRNAELASLLALGHIWNTRDDYRSARENYMAAWRLAQELDDPSSAAVALDGLARLDWIEGNLELAESRFKQALDLHRSLGRREGEARLLNALADFELSRFQPSTARQHAREALRIYRELHVPGGEVEALTTLGDVLRYEGKFDEALTKLEEALTLARKLKMPSDTVNILNNMGLNYSLNDQDDRATKAYQEALQMAKELGQISIQGDILLGLGDVQMNRRQYDEALRYYEEANELFNQQEMRAEQLNALFGLLAIHQARKEGDEAVKRAEEVVAQAEQLGDLSQTVRAMRSLASSLLLLYNFERALEVLDRALELRPFDPQTLAAKGDLLLDAAEYETAVSLFDQALERDKTNADLWLSRGWAFENMDPPRSEEALASYQKAVDLKKDELWAHKGIGNALRLAGENAAAQAKYRWVIDQALKSGPVKEEYYSMLGWCYYACGEYAEASKWLGRSLAVDPESISELFDLALCHLCLGDGEQAATLYEQGITELGQRQVLAQRGPLFVALTDLQEAVADLPSLQQSTVAQKCQELLGQALSKARAD